MLAIATVLLLVPLAQANHSQTVGGATLTFDHAGGNSWWVEVWVTGSAHYVIARVEGTSAWQSMKVIGTMNGPGTPSKWVPYQAFNVPAGKRVQFHAQTTDSTGNVVTVISCFFTHPAGVEQCDPGSTDPFKATFTNPSGNEWWEQVYVSGNRPITSVSLIKFAIDGTYGYTMTKRSWGARATSTFVEKGSLIRFSTSWGAEESISGCYRWPSAVLVECPKEWTPRYDPRAGGSEWRVEVDVGPIVPERVLARDEGGPWVEMTNVWPWKWQASFHIEPGRKVQFTSYKFGTWSESCWFTHPEGRGPSGEPLCFGTTASAPT